MNLNALIVGSLLIGALVQAQGTLNFSNVAAGVNAPISEARAHEWSAELWVGSCPDVLTPVPGSVTTFSVDRYFSGGTVVIPGFPAGSKPWVQVCAWDNQGGTITNHSQATQLGITNIVQRIFQLGGGLGDSALGPPANLVPFGSWPFGMAPPFYVLASHCNHQGALVLNIPHRDPSSALFTVLTSTNLTPVVDWQPWSVIPQDTQGNLSTVLSITLSQADGARFFRIAQ